MNAIEEVIKDYEDYIEGFILTKNWPQNDESMDITDTFPYLSEVSIMNHLNFTID